MSRRRYVVAYDISDDKRRNAVFMTLHGYGDHAQYSVFLCELTKQELVQLRSKLRSVINNTEDQVMIVDVGKASSDLDLTLEVLGKGYKPPVRSMIV